MTIKGILLAGVALCSISLSPAFAKSAPDVHFTALRPGTAVVKSAIAHKSVATLTETVYAYTSVPSTVKTKTQLLQTYYKWNDSSGGICSTPKEKVTLSTKKTTYAKLSAGTYTEPGSVFSCPNPVVFYGDTYELTAKHASGDQDSFTSTLKSKIVFFGTKYDATLNFFVYVTIE